MNFKNIKIYLNQLKRFSNMRDYIIWVLKNGRAFSRVGMLTPAEKELVKRYRYSTKPKQCYYNAQMLTLNNPKFKYYEGWYMSRTIGIPLEHGFNVYKNKVIDTTQYRTRVEQRDKYFGVRIPINFIRKNIVKTGMAEALLPKYYRRKRR